MNRLILLRHGEARPAERGEADMDRPLTDAGRAAAAQAGRVLAGAGEAPDVALVSPAVRTQQTWREVRAALPSAPAERTTRALYEMPPSELLRLAEGEGAACVLLVGHNPGLQALASDLAGADPRLAAGFPPGSAAVLERDGAAWRLVSVHRPGSAA